MRKPTKPSTSDRPPRRVYALPPLPDRPVAGHKGLFGRVLIVGGSPAMIGAPVLAGTAALRCGSGLVQVAMPAAVLPAALSITPELIGLPLDGRSDRALAQATDAADVIILGPGMGQSPPARRCVLRLIAVAKPLVLDADALNILAAERKWPRIEAPAVLTPHPGEMKRLARVLRIDTTAAGSTDDRERLHIAVDAARLTRQTWVLKGHRTVVAAADRVYVNRTGNSSLSKAGSGDVLAGMIGSLIGQGMGAFDAAVAATCLHGLAGEAAGKKLGMRCVLARDVIDAIPETVASFRAG